YNEKPNVLDASPYVRLQLASGLHRLPLSNRYWLARLLVSRPEIAMDNNLTLMIWYAIEPIVAHTGWEAHALAAAPQIPKLRQFIARRLVSGDETRFGQVIRWLGETTEDKETIRDILIGLHAGLEGRRNLKPNDDWMALSARFSTNPDAGIRELTQK